MPSYIYLVECENGEKKLGRTSPKVCTYYVDRLRAYGSCTIIKISRVSTHYVVQIETDIIAEFQTTFKLAHGREYFYGDAKKMEEIIDRHVAKYRYVEDPVVLVTDACNQDDVIEMPPPLLMHVPTPSSRGFAKKQKEVHICEGCGKDYTTRQAKYLHKRNNPSCKNAEPIKIYDTVDNMQKHMNMLSARITKLELMRK